MEDNYKCLQVEKESATVQQLALQNTNSVLMQENEHLECAIKMLKDENSILKVANKIQDTELLERSEKQDEKDTQKLADEKQDRQLLENFENQAHGDQEVSAKALTVKEQHYTLEEHFDEVVNEKQSKEVVIRDLQNASEQSPSEVEKQKPKAENLEKKLQQLSELPSPADQDHKSNISSYSKESFTIHIRSRGIDDEDDEVFQSEKSPLKDPPARISITVANKQSSETPINKHTTTEHKFMITSVQKNLVESSTKLLPTEHQSTDVFTKTQSTENHNTEHNVDTNETQRSSSSVPQALHTQSEEHSVEHTPFGKRIKSFRRPKSPNIDEKPQNSCKGPVVDNQLQNFFAKRQKKLSDENALATFEQSVQESMESNRANIKQNNDGKIVKENPGDRGVDTELFTKFQKRRSKIPQN